MEKKLQVGMKLKQKTEMGGFFQPDMEMEVVAINNGVATVRSNSGHGCMSARGYSQYFEIVNTITDEDVLSKIKLKIKKIFQ